MAAPLPSHAPDPRAHDATVILMVDDEPAVRTLYARLLRREGYRTLEAQDGAEALRVAADADRIDLVITDVLMPVMRGPDLAAALRASRPGLPCLFISGYAIEQEDLGPNAHALEKPFARDAFLKAVARIVGAPRAAV